jgi:hypothetical protein
VIALFFSLFIVLRYRLVPQLVRPRLTKPSIGLCCLSELDLVIVELDLVEAELDLATPLLKSSQGLIIAIRASSKL